MSAPANAAVRGRPKSSKKRKQIFKAAVDLFLENGFDGTSMDEVAVRAGVSKQTVYSHFKSKEDLFTHCICEKCVSYELSEEFLDMDVPVVEMLRNIGHKFSNLLLSEEAIRIKRLLCFSAEQSPQLGEMFYQAGPKHMIDLLTVYLQKQSELGRLSIPDFRTAACQFLYMIHGEAHFCELMNVSSRPDAKSIERYVDDCVDMFLRAHRPAI